MVLVVVVVKDKCFHTPSKPAVHMRENRERTWGRTKTMTKFEGNGNPVFCAAGVELCCLNENENDVQKLTY